MSVPARAGTVTRTRLTAVELGDGRRRTADALATEEPLEIRVDSPGMEQRRVAVTMRTPGHDFELAAGFLFTEGIVAAQGDVSHVRYCDVPREEQQYNVVTVDLRRPYDPELLQRNFYTTSSCGVCGKASLDSISVRCAPVAEGPEVRRVGRRRASRPAARGPAGVRPHGRPARRGPVRHRRRRCSSCARTSAATTPSTSWPAGPCSPGQLPLSERVLMVSGRLSFEIVQKAAVAGIPIVCAVSAPSSLAVDAGRRFGMTLVGFLRGSRFNIYTHPERISG